MTYITFILIKLFTSHAPWMRQVVLEKTTPIIIEMLYHKIKLISEKNIVFICSDPLQEDPNHASKINKFFPDIYYVPKWIFRT